MIWNWSCLLAVIIGLCLLLIVGWLLMTSWQQSRVDKKFDVSCRKGVLEYRDGARMTGLSYKFDGSKEGDVIFIFFQGANWNKPRHAPITETERVAMEQRLTAWATARGCSDIIFEPGKVMHRGESS